MTGRDQPKLRVARRGGGYAAWGPGFYVWDEEEDELLREAIALAWAARAQASRRARASSASRRRASIAAR
jgi:hypothetical protein